MEDYVEKTKIFELVNKWEKDSNIYEKQVNEARSKNSPHDQMLSAMTFLRSCAAELERLVK